MEENIFNILKAACFRILKLCHDDIEANFESGPLKANFEYNLVNILETVVFYLSMLTVCQIVCLNDIQAKFEYSSCKQLGKQLDNMDKSKKNLETLASGFSR